MTAAICGSSSASKTRMVAQRLYNVRPGEAALFPARLNHWCKDVVQTLVFAASRWSSEAVESRRKRFVGPQGYPICDDTGRRHHFRSTLLQPATPPLLQRSTSPLLEKWGTTQRLRDIQRLRKYR